MSVSAENIGSTSLDPATTRLQLTQALIKTFDEHFEEATPPLELAGEQVYVQALDGIVVDHQLGGDPSSPDYGRLSLFQAMKGSTILTEAMLFTPSFQARIFKNRPSQAELDALTDEAARADRELMLMLPKAKFCAENSHRFLQQIVNRRRHRLSS